MTSRERLVGAARGQVIEGPRPKICWPMQEADSDAWVGPLDEITEEVFRSERAVLADITNPFGLAITRNLDLNQAIRENPVDGNRALDLLCEEVKSEISAALEKGADGVFYRLYGARGLHSSPMQYGGFFLERDREILNEVSEARFNVVFVVGDKDIYLDFVSDLPCDLMGWDAPATGLSSDQVRQMRAGAQLSTEVESEVSLVSGLPGRLSEFLEFKSNE